MKEITIENTTFVVSTISTGENAVSLEKNELASLKGDNIIIRCIGGALLVTWPDGNEAALRPNQSVRISSKGKICILALEKSGVGIEKTIREIFRFFPIAERMEPTFFVECFGAHSQNKKASFGGMLLSNIVKKAAEIASFFFLAREYRLSRLVRFSRSNVDRKLLRL